MDEATKAHLIERFSAYLDAVDESAPEQAPAAPDLFTLLAEVSALKNEVKIESRQVKTALDEFRSAFDTAQRANARLEEELDRQREGEAQRRRESERELLLDLLDLRDRLDAGYGQARGFEPGWLARRTRSGQLLARMTEGLGMSMRRLDEALTRRGVERIECIDRAFDPQTMRAAETARRDELADGTVVGELRAGFRQDGQLLRAAEVVVNKREDVRD